MKKPRFALRRVRLNQGGYDDCGYYWGVGEPLYWYGCVVEGREETDYIRALSRDHAKQIVLKMFPYARFWR